MKMNEGVSDEGGNVRHTLGEKKSDAEIAVSLRPDEWEYILDLISESVCKGKEPHQSGVNPITVYDFIRDEVPMRWV
jgi:hypothetical protein